MATTESCLQYFVEVAVYSLHHSGDHPSDAGSRQHEQIVQTESWHRNGLSSIDVERKQALAARASVDALHSGTDCRIRVFWTISGSLQHSKDRGGWETALIRHRLSTNTEHRQHLSILLSLFLLAMRVHAR